MSPDNEVKLTRQQLRAREREERKQLKKFGISNEQASREEWGRLIDNEAARTVPNPDWDEWERWKLLERRYPRPEIPLNNESCDSAYELMLNILDLMRASPNPYFQKTQKLIADSIDLNMLSLNVEPTLALPHPVKDIPGASMSVSLTINEELQVAAELTGSAHHLLVNSSTMDIALDFVHEGIHLQKVLSAISQARPITSADQIPALRRNAFYQNESEWVHEEAKADAERARALIYQRGLGWSGEIDTTTIQDTAMFIRSEKNQDIQPWLNYTRSQNMPYLKS